MWRPEWLYERLPLLYLAASGLCLWILGTSFAAQLSAFAFFAAGICTFMLRRDARRREAARPRARASKF